MRGILLIRFTRSPGAFIDLEYPEKISEMLNLDINDIMNIYGIHRMRRVDPNFQKIKYKNIKIASFYTGFSMNQYVGSTDVCLTVLLSEGDILPEDFEGMLRRMANEILPLLDKTSIYNGLINYYNKLTQGEIDPYWFEEIDGKTVPISAAAGPAEFVEFSMDDLDFDEFFGQDELSVLRNELQTMNGYIKQQQAIIEKLQKTLDEQVSGKSDQIELIHKLKDEVEEKSKLIEDLVKENMEYRKAIKDLQGKTDVLAKLDRLKRKS